MRRPPPPALLALCLLACGEEPGDPAPTLAVRGFEVPEIPTDGAALDLDYVLPDAFVPGEGRAVVVTASLSGPAGLASIAGSDLEPAPDRLPEGDPDQVGAWTLSDLGESGPQDELDGAHGRRATFGLAFAATDEGSASLTLTFLDVPGPGGDDGPAGSTLDDVQYLRLTFHGGDEDAEVTTP
ncbi:hypothetical protein L6R50_23230 [Myxococcota bacterium]|nr:hypothetical protein [Myxococcota bacterium]